MREAGLIPVLAGLRGLAALAALWGRLGFVPFPALRPLLATDIADDLFFCLSGFLLTQAYDAGGARLTGIYLPGRYWRRRAWRLAPAAALLLVARLAPPVWPILTLLLCYGVIFPLFFAAARRPWARRAALPACGGFAFVGGVLWLERGWHPVALTHGGGGVMTALLMHGVAMFLAGACAGLLWRHGDGVVVLAGDAVGAVVLAMGLTLIGGCLGFNPAEFAGVAAPALVLGLAAAPMGAPGGAVARLLAAPPWLALGRLAYPLYLLFGPVRAVLAWAAPGLHGHPEAKAAAIAVALLLVAAAAAGFARAVEGRFRLAS